MSKLPAALKLTHLYHIGGGRDGGLTSQAACLKTISESDGLVHAACQALETSKLYKSPRMSVAPQQDNDQKPGFRSSSGTVLYIIAQDNGIDACLSRT